MKLEVDIELIKKYNRPGPRYTSYPTAPHFNESVNGNEWHRQIQLNNKNAKRDLSLYFHLPFCDTLCWFCGCTTVVTRNLDKLEEYLRYLYKEIDMISQDINNDRKVVQMHFGGGTPTYLSPEQILKLGSKINQSFSFSGDAEIGCEMDPRELTEDHIIALKEVGFKRASMGVQDFNPKVQKAVNRINPYEMVEEAVGWIRRNGFESLNLDLIYGLPHQSTSNFENTVDKILTLDPDRLAVFNYAHVPWMKPHQKLIKEDNLPVPEEKLEMLKMIIERLTSSGYVYIGMDHFAKADDELTIAQKEKNLQRNFQGYSTRAGADIYAFGMSSISQLEDVYVQNFKELSVYYEYLKNGNLPVEKGYILSDDDKIRRETIMRLMCDLELNYHRMSKLLQIDFQDYYTDELQQMDKFSSDGLIVLSPGKLSVTEKGRLFIRNIAMEFDSYLNTSETRYSKTI